MANAFIKNTTAERGDISCKTVACTGNGEAVDTGIELQNGYMYLICDGNQTNSMTALCYYSSNNLYLKECDDSLTPYKRAGETTPKLYVYHTKSSVSSLKIYSFRTAPIYV